MKHFQSSPSSCRVAQSYAALQKTVYPFSLHARPFDVTLVLTVFGSSFPMPNEKVTFETRILHSQIFDSFERKGFLDLLLSGAHWPTWISNWPPCSSSHRSSTPHKWRKHLPYFANAGCPLAMKSLQQTIVIRWVWRIFLETVMDRIPSR